MTGTAGKRAEWKFDLRRVIDGKKSSWKPQPVTALHARFAIPIHAYRGVRNVEGQPGRSAARRVDPRCQKAKRHGTR